MDHLLLLDFINFSFILTAQRFQPSNLIIPQFNSHLQNKQFNKLISTFLIIHYTYLELSILGCALKNIWQTFVLATMISSLNFCF